MDIKEIAKEINELLTKRRETLGLTFNEDDHIYTMKDEKGKLRTDYPSVSTVYKSFYIPFDADGKSLSMCNGNHHQAELLREQWRGTADYATNMGSRVHFELEKELVGRYGNYKDVRQPIFTVDEEQTRCGDMMISAGIDFIELMHERGAVLLDTEIVLGDNQLGYTGQPDKVWLMYNKKKDGFGFVITDWKTNQPKNFEVHHYTGWMLEPFQEYRDTALAHYYLQLPLYAKLLKMMLKGTKYEDIAFFGGVVVLLKNDATFVEYRIPKKIVETIMTFDIRKYLK